MIYIKLSERAYLKEMPARADTLSPDNVVAIMDSVITGTAISGQSRVTVVAKSPLTDCIGILKVAGGSGSGKD